MDEQDRNRQRRKEESEELQPNKLTIELVENLVGMYNRTPHNTIDMSPDEAMQKVGTETGRARIASAITKNSKGVEYAKAPKFNVNDLVRVGIRKPSVGAKADDPQYTSQLYQVAQVNKNGPKNKQSDSEFPTHVLTYRVDEIDSKYLVDGDKYYEPTKKELKKDKNIWAMYRDIPDTALRENSLVWANQVEDQLGDKMTDIFNQTAYEKGLNSNLRSTSDD